MVRTIELNLKLRDIARVVVEAHMCVARTGGHTLVGPGGRSSDWTEGLQKLHAASASAFPCVEREVGQLIERLERITLAYYDSAPLDGKKWFGAGTGIKGSFAAQEFKNGWNIHLVKFTDKRVRAVAQISALRKWIEECDTLEFGACVFSRESWVGANASRVLGDVLDEWRDPTPKIDHHEEELLLQGYGRWPCTAAEVDRAFRVFTTKHHPDKHAGEPAANERYRFFKDEVYPRLKDKARKWEQPT